MSSAPNVMYVETPVVRFRGKMWNVMMSCAYLQGDKLPRMDSNIDGDTHQMSIFDKYMPATQAYAEVIGTFIRVHDGALDPDLTVFFKNNETWHLKAFGPLNIYSETRKKNVKVEMIDGTVLDGGPGGRHQDVLILTVGTATHLTRQVKFTPAFVSTDEAADVDKHMRRAIVAGVHV